MATSALTEQTHDQTVQAGIVLIDFWAEWCGPCGQFGPVFEAVSEDNPDASFVKVDTEAEPELAAKYGVSSIPMLVIYRDGIPVFGQPGAMPRPALEEILGQVRGLDMDQVRTAYEQQLDQFEQQQTQQAAPGRRASTDPTAF